MGCIEYFFNGAFNHKSYSHCVAYTEENAEEKQVYTGNKSSGVDFFIEYDNVFIKTRAVIEEYIEAEEYHKADKQKVQYKSPGAEI